jgi:L-amino acid N-acyltransferase YncA
MTIRPAKTDDIPLLAEFWYDQMALLSQKSPAIRLAPNALQEWEAYAKKALHEAIILVAEKDGEILGGIIGQESRNAPALLPERFGLIVYLLVDMHSPAYQTNTASLLVKAMQEEFRGLGLSQCRVAVAAYAPVEQGFWRGLGANLLEEGFWIRL